MLFLGFADIQQRLRLNEFPGLSQMTRTSGELDVHKFSTSCSVKITFPLLVIPARIYHLLSASSAFFELSALAHRHTGHHPRSSLARAGSEILQRISAFAYSGETHSPRVSRVQRNRFCARILERTAIVLSGMLLTYR